MWSLGKVSATPEVMRVYISSFWEHPFAHDDNAKLFEAERNDLLTDLRNLPRNAAVRKVRLASCVLVPAVCCVPRLTPVASPFHSGQRTCEASPPCQGARVHH